MIEVYNEENFTRIPNLEKNDGLTIYRGFAAQQNIKAYEIFYNFLKKVKPKRILEIGTGLGGFIMYIKMCCDELNLDTKIISYDIYERLEYEELRTNSITVNVKNVFNDDYSEVENEVIDFIKQEGISLVLCDGGNKVGEFNLLSNFIKVGDFIMAHDYAPNREYFSEFVDKKIWNWIEIEDAFVENALKENQLESYHYDFLKAAWLCKYKK